MSSDDWDRFRLTEDWVFETFFFKLRSGDEP
jgi:hypothetical protein